MSLVLPSRSCRSLVCKESYQLSMELDFPIWLQIGERINLIRRKVRNNVKDMYIAIGAPLPLMWYLHIDEFPLLWSLNPYTLRVCITGIVYGMH